MNLGAPMRMMPAILFAALLAAPACKSTPKTADEPRPTVPAALRATGPAVKMGAVPMYYWDGEMHAEPHPIDCNNRDWHDHVHTLGCGHAFKEGHWWKAGAWEAAHTQATASK